MDRQLAISRAKILTHLIGIAEVSGILDTFINAFLHKSIKHEDGIYYLHGNFLLGGTKSGRMASARINLQNLPSSGTKYAVVIKQCFKAPPGYLLVGADFNSLEAKIGALLTHDPERVKIFTQGYDAHSVNSYAYWPEKMPDIVNTVDSINTIPDKYPDIRQESKAVSFASQYGGTWVTFMDQCGFPIEEAKQLEANYQELYSQSLQWTQKLLQQASIDGYVLCAFGLKLRTPLLAKVIMHSSKVPYAAEAEGRTANNATQQSWGMLNNRSSIEFMDQVWNSEYALDILPIAHIHDAQYFIAKNTYGCIAWLNDKLIPTMEWQDDPLIQHSVIKLGGELEVFYPTWAEKMKIPNQASRKTLSILVQKHRQKLADSPLPRG